MFDPNENRRDCEAYLSRYLGCEVALIQADRLKKSSREAPWRMEIKVNGKVQWYVLQLDPENIEREYLTLQAMENIPISTPRVYGLDLKGEALGTACYFCDFIDGESLLGPMLSGESWAEDLYIDAACKLQSVTEAQLGAIAQNLPRETAEDVLDEAYAYLKDKSLPPVDAAYQKLKNNVPLPGLLRFSNGDLWLENFIIKNKKLVGIIDFPNAMFSDPIYEFLLSFFASPKLKGRGIEERYCRVSGYNPEVLHWYHGLEFIDTLRWVMVTGEGFVHHTEESLKLDLQKWLDDVG